MIDGENKLRVWREHRGISAKELAEATGLAAPYISQARRNHRDVQEARRRAPRRYRRYRLASCRERGRVTGIQLSALDGSAFMLWSYN